ncbi:MAG TPA: endolytic transglycosylase MltG [Candidatus Polarisedimenticolia bacterium]|nr:endolytic transglycosylase MltG [Candidatus Polarisedimenticolia bacterium]
MRLAPLVVITAAILCCAITLGTLVWHGNLPYKGHPGDTVIVVVEPGRPARAAAAALEQAGVIRSALAFRLLMRVRRAEGALHAGEYAFSGALTPSQVLDKLVRGEVVRHKLTIPEGLRLDEIARVVEASGLGRKDAFLRAAGDAALVADLDPEARDLEGYLFPDTYHVPRGVDESRLVAEMVGRLRRELTPERRARLEQLGLSVRQALTLASLVEEEAGLDEERPRIAAVFHNRLRMGMPLQCDPTVVYALIKDGRYRGDIFRSDLSYRSPYNTYVFRGLPPGPISSPGAPSLDAVLRPAPTEDLYFVVSGPGRHFFSTNIKDHEQAVRRYRRDLSLVRRAP